VTQPRVQAWLVGTALAALLAAASLYDWPVMREAEARTLDLMFRYGRADPPEPSRAIVHLDVDDQALSMIGRWPWSRRRLADAINGIDSLGARVIAIDILLTEPDDRDPEGDRQLRDAFAAAKAKVILAVDPTTTRAELEGADAWRDVITALGGNIRLTADEVVAQLQLPPRRARSVRRHLNKYKRIAVREVVTNLRREGRISVEATRQRMVTATDVELVDFPELRLLRNEVARAEAALLLQRDLPSAQSDVSYGHADSILPPLAMFANSVAGPGVVQAEPDADGILRRVTLRWEIDGKVFPQLGAAAAAAYLGLPQGVFAPQTMVFPGEEGPFEVDGSHMLLSWARIDPEQPSTFAPHLSLGTVVELVSRERELAQTIAAQSKRTRELVLAHLSDDFEEADLHKPEMAAEIDSALADEAEFQTAGVETGGEPESEEDQRMLRLWRNWLAARAKVVHGRGVLEQARNRLSEALDGKLVFMGWSASGNFGDFYATAVHARTPGVVAHGVVASSLLTNYIVRPAPRWIGAALTLLLGLLAAMATREAGPRFSFLLALLIALVFITADLLIIFGRNGIAVATAAPLAAIFASWSGTTVMRAVRERREKAQLQRQFGARVSPQLFEFLLENPDTVDMEGEEREVTCFFSDLAGFTAISETLDSKATVALLNRYMFAMNEVLTRHAAYVNKFLGDGIMCVFGAFARDTPYADNACRAALECFERLDSENDDGGGMQDLPRLAMRIGIATGDVTLGDCGAPPDLRDYTVIGNSANLAARLESANKQFGTRILINGRTKELIGDDILTRPLGRVTVVGQKTATEIHEVLLLEENATDEDRDRIARTKAAVDAFAQGRMEDARALWSALEEDPATAVVARRYLEQIDAPAAEFDGVLHLTQK